MVVVEHQVYMKMIETPGIVILHTEINFCFYFIIAIIYFRVKTHLKTSTVNEYSAVFI